MEKSNYTSIVREMTGKEEDYAVNVTIEFKALPEAKRVTGKAVQVTMIRDTDNPSLSSVESTYCGGARAADIANMATTSVKSYLQAMQETSGDTAVAVLSVQIMQAIDEFVFSKTETGPIQ